VHIVFLIVEMAFSVFNAIILAFSIVSFSFFCWITS